MACVCSQYNKHSDWPIVPRALFPKLPTGQLQARKTKANSDIIHNLLVLNLNVWSLWENLKP